MGKRRHPCPVNRHASFKAAGGWARGIPHLPFGFASKPSLSAPWARGLLSAFWIWGYPDLPACGPPRGSVDGLVWTSFNINSSRSSRGAKPSEANDAKTPEGIGLFRLAPEGRRVLFKVHLMRLS